MLSGFKKFILRGNIIDLAVGVVVGVAFTTLVNSLVKDLLTPVISAFGGKPDFSTLSFTIGHSKFLVGDFLNSLISFLIIAAVIYFFVVLPVNKLTELSNKGKNIDPTTKKCTDCLSTIPKKAKRCAFCATIQKN